MSGKLYLYPVAIRFWHMINALMFLLLIVTGLSLQYATMKVGVVKFSLAITLHNIGGIVLSANYLIFIIGSIVSKNLKHYHVETKGMWNRVTTQARFYVYGMFRNEPPPFPVTEQMKFNPLQQLVYQLAIFIGLPLLIITGWAYLFPEIVPTKVFNTPGLLINDLLHITLGFILSLFMFGHIYLCTLGASPKKNFKSIITGYHEQ